MESAAPRAALGSDAHEELEEAEHAGRWLSPETALSAEPACIPAACVASGAVSGGPRGSAAPETASTATSAATHAPASRDAPSAWHGSPMHVSVPPSSPDFSYRGLRERHGERHGERLEASEADPLGSPALSQQLEAVAEEENEEDDGEEDGGADDELPSAPPHLGTARGTPSPPRPAAVEPSAVEVVGALAELGSGLHRMAGEQQRELLVAVSRCLSAVLRAADTSLPQYSVFLTNHHPAPGAAASEGGREGGGSPPAPGLPPITPMPPSSAVALRLTRALDGLLCRAIDGDSVADEAALAWLAEQLETWPRLPQPPPAAGGGSPSAAAAAFVPPAFAVAGAAAGTRLDLGETLGGRDGGGRDGAPAAELTGQFLQRNLGDVTAALGAEAEAVARALAARYRRTTNGAHGGDRGGLGRLFSARLLTYLLPLMVMGSSALTAWILTSGGGGAGAAAAATGGSVPGRSAGFKLFGWSAFVV